MTRHLALATTHRMKSAIRFLLVLAFTTCLGSAQSTAPSPELEKHFTTLLTNVTLTGRWCLVRDGALTPERDETYTIVGVQKVEGDKWIVNAKLNYQGQAIVAPIPVRMQWAGGAAVMIVENLTVPGGGTYSAHVLFHGQTYSGTWSGGDKTGMLHGMIKPTPGQ
jgi:hypothetical protein